MKYTSIIIIALFLMHPNLSSGQASGNPGKVKTEASYSPDPSEIEKRKLREQLSKKYDVLREAEDNYKRDLIKYQDEQKTYIDRDGKRKLKNLSGKEAMEVGLNNAKYEKNRIAHYNLISKMEDIVQLEQRLGNTLSNKWITNAEKVENQILEWDNKIRGIIKEKNNEIVNKANHESKMRSLDQELADLDNLSGNSTTFENKKLGSIDNFLSTMEDNSNDGNDFLDELINEENEKSDFLSVEDASSYNIENKNDLQGVVSSGGEILIPFDKWNIIEYSLGIAKVSKVVESRSVDVNWDALFPPGQFVYNDFYCYGPRVSKVGFVDKKGNFIEYQYNVSKPSFKNSGKLYLTRTSNDPKPLTAAQEARNKQRKEEIKKEQIVTAKRACLEKGMSIYNSLRSKYRN